MENEIQESLVDEFGGEWRKRPVNVMKVFKSLYHQLTKGADLTKISMPSEIYHPFSVLEVVAHRELSSISNLYQLNNYPDDSLQRFLCVARWIVSFLSQEDIEKKPYNPTIGEEHICWIEHSSDERTELFVEQVSHHPPLTALFLRNEKQKISLLANIDSAVSFGGNSVTISSAGEVIIDTAFERYLMNKHVPNLIIRRIIFGEKYYAWNGSLTLECPNTGYKLDLSFSEKNENNNRVRGQVTKDEEVLFEIKGNAGKEIYYWKPEEGEKKKKEFYKFESNVLPPKISYPPVDCRVPNNSLRQWKEVSEAIIKNDMQAADIAKNKIEQLQRIREKKRIEEGKEYEGTYFRLIKENEKRVWEAREDIRLNREYLEELKERALEIEKKLNEEVEKLNDEEKLIQEEENLIVDEENLIVDEEKFIQELDIERMKLNEKEENEIKKMDSQSIKKKAPINEIPSKKEKNGDENCIIS